MSYYPGPVFQPSDDGLPIQVVPCAQHLARLVIKAMTAGLDLSCDQTMRINNESSCSTVVRALSKHPKGHGFK